MGQVYVEERRMSLVVRAFPMTGSVEDLKAFVATLNSERKTEAAAFYRKFGVSQETWHLQETPVGRLVIVVSVVDNPASSASVLAASSAEFDAWFKEQVLRLSGVDQAQQPLGPPTTQVFAWSDDDRRNLNPAA